MNASRLGITAAVLAWFAVSIFAGVELVAHTGGRGYEIPVCGTIVGIILGVIVPGVIIGSTIGAITWWDWVNDR